MLLLALFVCLCTQSLKHAHIIFFGVLFWCFLSYMRYVLYSYLFSYFTALFNNTRTPKLKAQPTNAFFAAVNQVFGGSSQLTTTAELCSLSELCTTI